MRALAAILAVLALAVRPAGSSGKPETAGITAGMRILDRNGAVLAVFPASDGAYAEPLTREEIPDVCADLFVRMEDKRFYRHHGVDPAALLRAAAGRAAARVSGGRTQRAGGASTITMQLARILHPHPRTFGGKLAEMRAALNLEAVLSKNEILLRYLNLVPFSRNIRGVGGAARIYYDADLSALSDAQLLVLAVIPRNPRGLDPFASPCALIRTAAAESRRLSLGITEEGIRDAVASARPGRPRPSPAPHFTRMLAARSPGGGVVRSTLDIGLTRYIQGRIRAHLDDYARARVTNAACVVIENGTGAVRAWVGSRDYQDQAASGQIDGVLIRRQTASVIKPFLYGFALTKGMTPATLLPDIPLDFGPGDIYRPANFDGKSRGVVRLRTALGSSLNVPAVFTLSSIGIGPWVSHLRKLGFGLPVDAAARYGLGAAVGNAEVSLLELTRAFAVFPRGGTLPSLSYVEGDGPGSPEEERVYDPQTAWLVADILSDPAARATGFGTRTYFRMPFPAMFKSGTSSEFTNLWCLAATPQYTVGVWAGNFDGRAVINKTGSIVPAQIAADALKHLTLGGSGFKRPPGILARRICSLTGAIAAGRCPSTREEYFRGPAEVPPPCSYHTAGGGREDLLAASLVSPGPAPVILHPVREQLFYVDPSQPEETQRIPVLIAAPAGDRLRVSLDGEPALYSRGRLFVPARRGRHVLDVRTPGGEASVTFTVR
jgi:penicillin-binding protein 1C